MDLFSKPPPPTNPPRVPQSQFMGAIWGGTALSLVFLAVRLYARFKGPRRLYWDDALVIFAWILALLSAICWQVVVNYLYGFFHVIAGLLWPPPVDCIERTEKYYVSPLIVLIFFYTSLYSIKLSFLLFFKRLGHNVANQKYIWWPVFIFTMATYFVCIGDIQYKCIVGPFAEIVASCSSDENIDFTLITLKVNAALDVLTDFLIMILPFTILWSVQMRWRKKLAVLGLFSLVLITMVFAIVRVTVTKALTRQPDETWLYLWSSIEQSIAIIVASLSAFPRLFTQSKMSAKPVFQPSDTYKSMMRRIRSGEKRKDFMELSTFQGGGRDLEAPYLPGNCERPHHFPYTSKESSSSQQEIIPTRNYQV